VQVDEIWNFCYCKQKNLTMEIANRQIAGDVWTFTAIDADTKLVLSWLVGQRDAGFAAEFLQDVAGRLSNRIQLTTDGHKMYLAAVAEAFGPDDIDYAQLVKVYGNDPEGQKRYSPAQCLGTLRQAVAGDPDPDFVSTSYVERQNLNMRMGMRRFTRLTNAFSKKVENLVHSVALFHMHYNFARVHQTLRVTPAMKAGLSSHPWSIQALVELSSGLAKAAA
jgi:IS1 family transposase